MDRKLPALINDTNVFMWGVNDLVYNRFKGDVQYCLFILHQDETNIQSYLKHIRDKSYHVDDYIFNLRDPGFHMSVLRVNRTWRSSYTNFTQGRFSKMYTNKQLVRIKVNPRLVTGKDNAIYQVLTHDERYRPAFEQKLLELYNTTIETQKDVEFDSFSFSQTFEVFNAFDKPPFGK